MHLKSQHLEDVSFSIVQYNQMNAIQYNHMNAILYNQMHNMLSACEVISLNSIGPLHNIAIM